MPILPLHFTSALDACAFIKTIGLNDFLLVNKQTTLLARYTEAEVSMAMSKYGAYVDDTMESFQFIREHFRVKSAVDVSEA